MGGELVTNLKEASSATLRRLSIYYRTLDILEQGGLVTVSSQELGEMEGVSGSVVRRDFSQFGSFGQRGQGYDVSSLKRHIARILGLGRRWNVVLVGASQLSSILINSEILRKKDFHLTKIFDDSMEFVGKTINGIIVSHINDLEKDFDPEEDHLAIIAVSPPEIQSIINRLGKIGCRGALYFASRSIRVPKNMFVCNQDISIDLGTITYRITH